MKSHITRCVHCATLVLSAGAVAQAPHQTLATSVSSTNQYANGRSWPKNTSDDGRYHVLISSATNLVPNDTNNSSDVFVRDVVLNSIRRVSVSSTGVQGNAGSGDARIASDGSFVVFDSHASNLVAGDTNNSGDVFLHDLASGVTVRLSVNELRVEGNGGSGQPTLSPDDRYVGFVSSASNLVPNDTNGYRDSFGCDLQTRTVFRVSVNGTGQEGFGGDSYDPYFSSGGRYAVFGTRAGNIISPGPLPFWNVVVKDLYRGSVALASTNAASVPANAGCEYAVVSSDGRYVVFHSAATNLVVPDTAGVDTYRKDMVTGSIERITVNTQGVQQNGAQSCCEVAGLSSDGRFVAFSSSSTNLVPNDANGTASDVFLRDTVLGTTTLLSENSAGVQGDGASGSPYLSQGGSCVAFDSDSSNLAVPPPPPSTQTYRRVRRSPYGTSRLLGWGCGGSGGIPDLYVSSPRLGSTVTVSGRFVGASTIGLVVASMSGPPPTAWGGCMVYVDLQSIIPLLPINAGAQGEWQSQFSLSGDPALTGGRVTLQAAFVGRGVAGVDLTSGIGLIFGD